jgi:hypothetical protein
VIFGARGRGRIDFLDTILGVGFILIFKFKFFYFTRPVIFGDGGRGGTGFLDKTFGVGFINVRFTCPIISSRIFFFVRV